MNFKPAEQWVKESRNPNVVVSPAMRDLEIERIRQIQADTLRYAIAFVKERQLIRATLQELNHQANQLDPRPE